jgi:DNA repair ATPase RecN
LALVAAGERTPDIGQQLGIAQNTVKSHLSKVYEKTGSRNRVDAVRYYLDHYTTGDDNVAAASASPRRRRGRPPLLQRQIQEIDARIARLKPAADELERLQRARDALRAADAPTAASTTSTRPGQDTSESQSRGSPPSAPP